MLIEELRASFWTQFTPSTLPQAVSTRQDCEHLLFFDGGIHATSETAAFGAVLVEVNTTSSDASIVWTSDGTLAAPSSTLHQALYKGLIVGLRAARERHLTQLEVIGCNALVLRQLRDHRPPRNRALANLYLSARQLADLTEVSAWTRHPRAHNKMAGRLGKLGTTPSGETPLEPLRSQDSRAALSNLLYNDLRPWWPTRVHHPDT